MSRELIKTIVQRYVDDEYLATRSALIDDLVAALDRAKREQQGLPVCPDCQQGYICEHCGKPMGDYYSER